MQSTPSISERFEINKLRYLLPTGLVLLGWIAVIIFSGSLLYKIVLNSNGELSKRVFIIPLLLILLAAACWIVSKVISRNPTASKYILVLILVVGASLRMGWILAFPTNPISDFQVNHEIALELSQGETRTSYPRPIGYAAILSFAYRVYSDPAVGRWLNVLFSSMTIFVTYLIGRLEGGPFAGLFAALFLAFSFTEIPMTSVLCTETGSLALLLISLYFSRVWRRNPKNLIMLALVGGIFWLSGLYRQAMLFFLPVFLFAIGKPSPDIKWGKAFLWFFSGILATCLGLGIWFSLIGGKPFTAPFTATVGSTTILTGTNFASQGIFNPQDAQMYSAWAPAERDRRAVEEALRRIQSDPAAILFELVPAKMARFLGEKTYAIDWALYPIDRIWSAEQLEYISLWLKVVAQAWYLLSLLAGSLYFIRALQFRDRFWSVLVGLMAMSVLPFILLEATPRYHHPFLAFVALAAGIGLSQWGKPGRADGFQLSMSGS
jgi:hypothetical protein